MRLDLLLVWALESGGLHRALHPLRKHHPLLNMAILEKAAAYDCCGLSKLKACSKKYARTSLTTAFVVGAHIPTTKARR